MSFERKDEKAVNTTEVGRVMKKMMLETTITEGVFGPGKLSEHELIMDDKTIRIKCGSGRNVYRDGGSFNRLRGFIMNTLTNVEAHQEYGLTIPKEAYTTEPDGGELEVVIDLSKIQYDAKVAQAVEQRKKEAEEKQKSVEDNAIKIKDQIIELLIKGGIRDYSIKSKGVYVTMSGCYGYRDAGSSMRELDKARQLLSDTELFDKNGFEMKDSYSNEEPDAIEKRLKAPEVKRSTFFNDDDDIPFRSNFTRYNDVMHYLTIDLTKVKVLMTPNRINTIIGDVAHAVKQKDDAKSELAVKFVAFVNVTNKLRSSDEKISLSDVETAEAFLKALGVNETTTTTTNGIAPKLSENLTEIVKLLRSKANVGYIPGGPSIS